VHFPPVGDIERLLNGRIIRYGWKYLELVEYLVDWLGYGPEENHRVHGADMFYGELVRAYDNIHCPSHLPPSTTEIPARA